MGLTWSCKAASASHSPLQPPEAGAASRARRTARSQPASRPPALRSGVRRARPRVRAPPSLTELREAPPASRCSTTDPRPAPQGPGRRAHRCCPALRRLRKGRCSRALGLNRARAAGRGGKGARACGHLRRSCARAKGGVAVALW